MNKHLQKLYESHHTGRREGFAIWEQDRGKLFRTFIGKGKKVLDVGCRDGTLTKHYVQGNDVTGIDIDNQMLTICERMLGIKTLHLDLYDQWPFKAASYDVVVMGEVLEHLFQPEKAVIKARKVLIKGGMLIGSVPNFYHIKRRMQFFFGEPVDVFEDPTHVTVFGTDKLRRLLQRNFTNVKIIGLGRKTFGGLLKIFPSLLAHTLVFRASRS